MEAPIEIAYSPKTPDSISVLTAEQYLTDSTSVPNQLMASDKEILRGLKRGIVAQSEVSIEQNGDNVGNIVKGGGGFTGIHNNAIIAIVGDDNDVEIDIPSESTEKIEELQSLIDEPKKNENEIREIHEWFCNHLPLVASVITVTKFGLNLGLNLAT